MDLASKKQRCFISCFWWPCPKTGPGLAFCGRYGIIIQYGFMPFLQFQAERRRKGRTRLTKKTKQRVWWAVSLLALLVFAVAMAWLHYQQLCSPGGGNDPYTSDLGQHLAFAQKGMIYSTTSLLIGPAYALGGRWGIAILLALFHLAAIAVFARGLRPALPQCPAPVRLLIGLVVNFALAVWMPRGGYWYQGTIIGTVYHNTTYIMLVPFALLAVLSFYRAWHSMSGKLDLRAWLVYTVLLTLATSFKASLVFAFAPALLLLLIADLIRTRGENFRQEFIMGCSVLPSIGLCLIQANVLFADAGSGMNLIFLVVFDRHRMLWGPFNEAAVLGLLRSLVFVAAVGILLGRRAWKPSATGSVCCCSVWRWQKRCCWWKMESVCITQICGGDRSSASGCSCWSRSASGCVPVRTGKAGCGTVILAAESRCAVQRWYGISSAASVFWCCSWRENLTIFPSRPITSCFSEIWLRAALSGRGGPSFCFAA